MEKKKEMEKTEKTVKKLPKYTDDRGREYFFDNAKFILIVFVVLAHAIAPMKDGHDLVKAIWILLNSFHMACFIFISGYFAKNYIKKDGSVKMQRLFTYLMYYLFCQVAMTIFEIFVLGHKVDISVFLPRPALWYLLCMILWFTILPYVSKIKIPVAIACAVVFGLLVGYDAKAGGMLSLCRAVTHFPFFLVGFYFKKEWLFKFRNKWTQMLSALILIGFGVFFYFNYKLVATRILECSYNYNGAKLVLFTGAPWRWINRLLFYVIAVILCAAFLTLVPRIKLFFTRFGSRTLQVYIIHRFLYFCEEEFGWHKLPFFDDYGVYKMMLIAILITFILSLKPFEYPFIWISKIKLNPLLKPEHQTK